MQDGSWRGSTPTCSPCDLEFGAIGTAMPDSKLFRALDEIGGLLRPKANQQAESLHGRHCWCRLAAADSRSIMPHVRRTKP